MRIVGDLNRIEFEADPVRAFKRALELDRKLRLPLGEPMPRGVTRAKHADFNRIDDRRREKIARTINW